MTIITITSVNAALSDAGAAAFGYLSLEYLNNVRVVGVTE